MDGCRHKCCNSVSNGQRFCLRFDSGVWVGTTAFQGSHGRRKCKFPFYFLGALGSVIRVCYRVLGFKDLGVMGLMVIGLEV